MHVALDVVNKICEEGSSGNPGIQAQKGTGSQPWYLTPGHGTLHSPPPARAKSQELDNYQDFLHMSSHPTAFLAYALSQS